MNEKMRGGIIGGLMLGIIFSLFTAQALGTNLKAHACDGVDAASNNAAIILKQIGDGGNVQLPAGSFQLNPLAVSGGGSITVEGTIEGGTRKTNLYFSGASGFSFLNTSDVQFNNLNILGPDNSELIAINTEGEFKASNLYLDHWSSGVTSSCLILDLSWLIPVLSILL